MADFDILKPWVILISGNLRSVNNVALELTAYIEMLRSGFRIEQKSLPIINSKDPSAINYMGQSPHIVLRAGEGKGSGFSWRMDKFRLEITGESGRGLFNGMFDFLSALGFKWKTPGNEELPHRNSFVPHIIPLREAEKRYSGQKRYLLFNANQKKVESWILWAARNRIDALVFPLASKAFGIFFEKLTQKTEKYEIDIEAGGWELPLLVPRKHTLFHKEMFRMNEGKRDKKINFCPTSPETIQTLSREAQKVFLAHPYTKVFHLWPTRGHEQEWCSCPTCRAFTAEEQNRIAINTVADVLHKIAPSSVLSYCELATEKSSIALRENVIKISHLLDAFGQETSGWFFAGF
ncbi:MAG: DUF4838 domain-containing protein [Treponema sp.]|jgi:hypothetical protein|nr:DUF4838 domain-containing protein [Treponema sp.]